MKSASVSRAISAGEAPSGATDRNDADDASVTGGGCVDIGRVLDDGPFTLLQKFVVVLAALSIVVDGFDGQLIGFAIPLLIKEWQITRNAFAPVVAAGLCGMGIGSACAGLFADPPLDLGRAAQRGGERTAHRRGQPGLGAGGNARGAIGRFGRRGLGLKPQ